MNIFIIIVFVCSLLAVLIGLAIYLPVKNNYVSSSNKGESSYTCNNCGCKESLTGNGEFRYLKTCEESCKSYVKENNSKKCKLVKGVPWNSYSKQKTCEK